MQPLETEKDDENGALDGLNVILLFPSGGSTTTVEGDLVSVSSVVFVGVELGTFDGLLVGGDETNFAVGNKLGYVEGYNVSNTSKQRVRK